MGESVKDFPLDIVKIEGSHETNSVSTDFIKTETSPECNIIKNELLPHFQYAGTTCSVGIKSENLTTNTFFHGGVEQETIIDNESDIAGYYNVVKHENTFEAYDDDNACAFGISTSKIVSEDSVKIENSKCNSRLENGVKSENVSDALTTDAVKEESCNVDKDIHNNVTSFDVSVSLDGPESQHKTGPRKYTQGTMWSNTDIESGSLPEDDSNVEIDIANGGGEGLVDFPDFSMDVEGIHKGHDKEQHLIYKSFSQVEVPGKSVTTAFKNELSGQSVGQHNGNDAEEGEKPFQYSKYGKASCQQSNLNRHIRIYTGKKPFECITCGKAFSEQSNLQVHIRTHTGEKRFECPTCGKAFSQQSNLKVHIRTHTGEKPFECPTCGKTFYGQSGLQTHIRMHTGEKRFECPTCAIAFSQKSTLQNHVRIHTGEKPFECPTCTKAFSLKSSLQSHLRTHTGEKPFECPTCGKAFSTQSYLHIHIRTHTGEKPFGCPICGKAFSRKSNLQDHIRTHTGEKRFECSTCGKTFSDQSNLRSHIKTHVKPVVNHFVNSHISTT